MNTKKIISFVLSMAMILPLATTIGEVTPSDNVILANAEDEDSVDIGATDDTETTEATETTDDTSEFEYTADKYFRFTAPTAENTVTITSYVGNIKNVNIPPTISNGMYTVIGIDSKAFYDNDSITSVTLPNTIKTISSDAFNNCDALERINLESVETIGAGAFRWCTALTEVGVLENTISIGSYAFYSCPSLMNVTVTSNLERLGEYSLGYNNYNNPYTNFQIYYNEYETGTGTWDLLMDYTATKFSIPVRTDVTEPPVNYNFDVNGDGSINVLDLVLLKKKILKLI